MGRNYTHYSLCMFNIVRSSWWTKGQANNMDDSGMPINLNKICLDNFFIILLFYEPRNCATWRKKKKQ